MTASASGWRLRAGGAADTAVMLAMIDEAVAWLVARGRSGQWGTEPWSTQPRQASRIGELAAGGGAWIGEIDGVPAGALVVSDTPPGYAPPVAEPELYVRFLVTSRRFAGRRVGRRLLDHARVLTGERGMSLLRVDCWAGGDGALVAYYTGAGFTPAESFQVGDWPGRILHWRVPAAP